MDRALARFITWVVARQAGLLIVVAALVLMLAYSIHKRAKESAIEQASQRQMMLCEQTAIAIENYYDSIVETLDLVRRTDESEDESTTAPATPLTPPRNTLVRQPGRQHKPRGVLPRPAGVGGPVVRQVLLPVFWEQLHDRATHLFTLERPGMHVVRRFAVPGEPPAEAFVQVKQQWLANVNDPAISPAIQVDGRWVNIVCVPVPRTRRLICAVVPLKNVQEQFLTSLTGQGTGGALLADEAGRVLYFPDSTLVGKSVIADSTDPEFKKFVLDALNHADPQTHVFEKPLTIGGVQMGRVLASQHPIQLPDGRWWLSIATSLNEVKRVVDQMFWRVAAFAAVAIAVFTFAFIRIALAQINNRTRLERLKHEILEREIESARKIQLAWLPHDDAAAGNIDIRAINKPASHISGDFYNWFRIADGRLCVVIGDVTGHGMAAAFLMATTQLLVRAAIQRIGDPGRALTAVNHELCQQVFNGQFVTMLVLLIDEAKSELLAASAGHPPPVIEHGGRCQLLSIEPELVLGVDPEWTYPTQRLVLPAPGGLLLYTDGVIEAASETNERFESDNLVQCLRGRCANATAMRDGVLDAVDRFRGSRDLADDLTVVAVRFAAIEARDRGLVGVM